MPDPKEFNIKTVIEEIAKDKEFRIENMEAIATNIVAEVDEIRMEMARIILENGIGLFAITDGWFKVSNDIEKSTYKVGTGKWDYGEPSFWNIQAPSSSGRHGVFFEEFFFGQKPHPEKTPDLHLIEANVDVEIKTMLMHLVDRKKGTYLKDMALGSIKEASTISEYLNLLEKRKKGGEAEEKAFDEFMLNITIEKLKQKADKLLIANIEQQKEVYIKVPGKRDWELSSEFRISKLTYYYGLMLEKLKKKILDDVKADKKANRSSGIWGQILQKEANSGDGIYFTVEIKTSILKKVFLKLSKRDQAEGRNNPYGSFYYENAIDLFEDINETGKAKEFFAVAMRDYLMRPPKKG